MFISEVVVWRVFLIVGISVVWMKLFGLWYFWVIFRNGLLLGR